MSERSHIIEIESLVLDGVDHLRPREVRALIEREVRRALRPTESVHDAAINEGDVANAVARSVERATAAR